MILVSFFRFFDKAMLKKSRLAAAPEPPPVLQVLLEKSHMVCLRSTDGHLFLVDRNCAMVSGVLRQAMRNRASDGTGTATGDEHMMTHIGSESYQTFTLDEIGSDMLELALRAMYMKYRCDTELEKRSLELLHTAETRHKLAALSVLLDM